MASVLGHVTVTHQCITRNLNPESSRFFVCAAAPPVTRNVRAERAPAVGCRAHADEGARARAGRRHVPGPAEREAAPRRAAKSCAWLVAAEGDLCVLRHHGEVRTARRPDVVPCHKCVKVKFVSKDDPHISHEWNSGAINWSSVFPWQRMKSCCFSWPNNGPLRCLSRRLSTRKLGPVASWAIPSK